MDTSPWATVKIKDTLTFLQPPWHTSSARVGILACKRALSYHAPPLRTVLLFKGKEMAVPEDLPPPAGAGPSVLLGSSCLAGTLLRTSVQLTFRLCLDSGTEPL